MDLQEIITDKKDELYASFEAVCQSRSDYQLKHFVVQDHATPERRYLQAVIEMQAKVSNLRRAAISRRKLLKRIETETDPDDRELLEIELEELDLSVKGAVREFNTLYAIYKSMPKYKAEHIQEAEQEYWEDRLTRQATLDVIATGRIGVGNLNALRQAGMLPTLRESMERLQDDITPKERKNGEDNSWVSGTLSLS
jgi:hypothetical protein